MVIEDNLPEKFRAAAFHPSLFIYAFKRNVLDKLFEELMQSNIAILGGEAWRIEGELNFGIIPLKDGSKQVLSWKIERKAGEDWYDFVERSIKKTLELITSADLEKKVTARTRQKLYYNFELKAEIN